MATDLPLATNESTPISVPVASSDATTDLSSPNPDQVIEENPVESDPKRQKVENADYNISYDGSTKKEQLLLEDVEKDEEEEKFRLYVKRMKETDGFDLRDLPLPKTLCGGVLPVDIDTDEYVLTTTSPLERLICHPNQNFQKSMKLGSGIGGTAVRKPAFSVRKGHLNNPSSMMIRSSGENW
ncbi:hypothetical protein LINGRAHAP2_LOCUS30321 [Linum grandiflorum]